MRLNSAVSSTLAKRAGDDEHEPGGPRRRAACRDRTSKSLNPMSTMKKCSMLPTTPTAAPRPTAAPGHQDHDEQRQVEHQRQLQHRPRSSLPEHHRASFAAASSPWRAWAPSTCPTRSTASLDRPSRQRGRRRDEVTVGRDRLGRAHPLTRHRTKRTDRSGGSAGRDRRDPRRTPTLPRRARARPRPYPTRSRSEPAGAAASRRRRAASRSSGASDDADPPEPSLPTHSHDGLRPAAVAEVEWPRSSPARGRWPRRRGRAAVGAVSGWVGSDGSGGSASSLATRAAGRARRRRDAAAPAGSDQRPRRVGPWSCPRPSWQGWRPSRIASVSASRAPDRSRTLSSCAG